MYQVALICCSYVLGGTWVSRPDTSRLGEAFSGRSLAKSPAVERLATGLDRHAGASAHVNRAGVKRRAGRFADSVLEHDVATAVAPHLDGRLGCVVGVHLVRSV